LQKPASRLEASMQALCTRVVIMFNSLVGVAICSGALLALAQSPPAKARMVAAARLGYSTMARRPFALPDSILSNGASRQSATAFTWSFNLLNTHACPLCNGCSFNHRAGVYHFINECTHPSITRFRVRLQRACLNLLLEMANKVHDTCTKAVARMQRFSGAGTADNRYELHRVRVLGYIQVVRQHLQERVGARDNNGAIP